MQKNYNFRKKALLLVISAVCLPFFSYAQEQIITGEDVLEEVSLSDDILAMGTNNVTYLVFDDGCMTRENITEIPHSQKTLTWSNGRGGKDEAEYYSLTLSRFISDGKDYSRLVIHNERPNEYTNSTGDYLFNDRAGIRNFIFPDTIDIFDVKVFDDTVYFCGSIERFRTFEEMSESNDYTIRDTGGFLGWISVNDLFNTNTFAMQFTKRGCILKKLRIFKDINDNKIRKIAAMGCYKKPREVYRTIDGGFAVSPASYNDMVFLYNPLGQSKIIKSPNNTDVERFQDIKMIGGDICIASLWYDTTSQLYTGTGEEISSKVYYRTVRASDMQQTTSYFNIKWRDILTKQYYDVNTKKGVYNVRLDYADWGYGYTNLNANNNTGNYIGFGIDDDMPVTYYDNYEQEQIPYEYKLLLSFNHYEQRSEGDYYAVILNWVSPNELIRANNGKYMGAKCSARIWEGNFEKKLIDINKLPQKTYKHEWEDLSVPSSTFSIATSEYSVILEDIWKNNYIYGVVLDDHMTDGEYFWTNTLTLTSNRYEGNYIKGGVRSSYLILQNSALTLDTIYYNNIKLNDINYIQGNGTHYFRTVGNIFNNTKNLEKLYFFQYLNWNIDSPKCHDKKPDSFYERAYPVTINYTDTNNDLIVTNVNSNSWGIGFIEVNACSGMGECEDDNLTTNKSSMK
ncbi:MAG: hypothetical protein IJ213_04000 [Bacteroidales bacterium]|nr:hypothetical protein [Bacteroidales bacterium]